LTVIIPSRNEPNINSVIAEIEAILSPDRIIISNDRYSLGKGWAVREGLNFDDDCYIIIDGDGDIKPKEILKLIPYIQYYDIILGRKALPKRFSRKILTILSRLWIYLLFGIKYDTQTGLKIFNFKPP
jgi:hypothetical protein